MNLSKKKINILFVLVVTILMALFINITFIFNYNEKADALLNTDVPTNTTNLDMKNHLENTCLTRIYFKVCWIK